MAKTSVIPWVFIGAVFLYVILFQIQMGKCQEKISSSTDMLPFCIKLPRALETSHIIKITGVISQPSSGTVIPAPWLNVILTSKCSSRQSPFYLRMQVNNGTTITGNTFDNGHWGEEIKGKPLTIPTTGQFVLLIAIQPDGYMVTGTGVALWTLPHRLSYTDVTRLSVRGVSTSILKIELIDQADPDPQRNTEIFYPVPLEAPVSNPTFPFWGYFPGGLQLGKAIRIKGCFPKDVPGRERTSIDLAKNPWEGPVMLHMDIRFKYHSDTLRVVRNFKDADGIWPPSAEERSGPFPFNIGENFTILIHVEPNYYNISVNGIPYWTFTHKLPFTDVTQLVIHRSTTDIFEVAYIDPFEKEDILENLTGDVAKGTVTYTSQTSLSVICIALLTLVNHCLHLM